MDEKTPAQIFNAKVLQAHKEGDIHIHSLKDTGKGYSSGWSVKKIEEKYTPTNLGELFTSINKHLKALKNEWIGPQSFNNLDLTSAKYPSLDEQRYYTFIKSLPGLVAFSLNPENEKLEEFHLNFQKSLEKVYLEGVFTAVPLINIKETTDWGSPNLGRYIANSFKYGNIHFQNYLTGTITFDQLTEKPRKPDLGNLHLRQGGIAGNSDGGGVLSIITINLPRLGYMAKDEGEFFTELENILEVAFQASEEKRAYLEKMLEEGLLAVTKDFVDCFDWYHSVINLSGMNEALGYAINAGAAHVAGKAVTYKLLEKILWKLEEYQKESGSLYSLESLPSEEAGAILASKDSLKHPRMFDDTPVYYTDSTNLPPDHGDDLWDWLEHQKKYHSIYTGGTMFQVRLSGMIQFRPECVLLIRKILQEFGYNYLKVSPDFTLCRTHGYLNGILNRCSICGEKATSYTWTDGFLRPLSSLNNELKEVNQKRVYHSIKSSRI